MKKALLISIHPEWAEKILNGEKTIEIRTWIPKDYVGWVYVYVTLGELIERHWKKVNPIDRQIILYGVGVKKSDLSSPHSLNGKVAFRFWFENYQTIKWEQYYYEYVKHDLLLETCLTNEQVENYGKGRTLYAWHIDKLEIFDKPKELSEFYHYKERWVNDGTNPPYLDEFKTTLYKAPQKCAWVYVEDSNHEATSLHS